MPLGAPDEKHFEKPLLTVPQKALNIFNAAMVTPTYYVYFTSTTIITSAVLFQGFKGTATSIATVVMGFLVICSGVVLLQLSKSAKDVPDAAVFAGDLNQIHTIAEQEQPESEPKADAIRGAAALVRRFSTTREKMEVEEMKRIREEKEWERRERLESVHEEGGAPEFEWDGLRRRRTTLGSRRGDRAMTTPGSFSVQAASPHPPLGMSHFPTDDELTEHDRPFSAGLSSVAGTIRSRITSVLPGNSTMRTNSVASLDSHNNALNISNNKVQSPMHPVQLTEITVPAQDNPYGVPTSLSGYDPGSSASSGKHIHFGGETRHMPSSGSLAPPTPPPHGPPQQSAKRQFSFQNVFRRNREHEEEERPTSARSSNRPISSRGYSAPHVKTATGECSNVSSLVVSPRCTNASISEEERLGLVAGDNSNRSAPQLTPYDEDDYDGSPDDYEYDDDVRPFADEKANRYGRGITESPNRGRAGSGSSSGSGHDMGLGIRGADTHGYDTPPRPPTHRSGSGTPGNGSGADGSSTPVSGRGGNGKGAFL